MKVAILGFGTVGSSVARILCEHPPKGVELGCIFNRGIERKRVSWVPSTVLWSEDFGQVMGCNPDIVVELAGGLHPAGEWVREALAAGKSVVTANKKLIAEQGIALEALARQHGCQLLYGAAVAGGVPVIPAVQQGLAGDRINRIHGILNGTCNFILSNMEDGAEFAPTLREAQERGYAEANPTEDVDGFDARAKLVILSRIGLRVEVLPEEVACRTISDVSAIDFAYAKDLQCTIRQISRAEVRDQRAAGYGRAHAGATQFSRCRGHEERKTWSFPVESTEAKRSSPGTGRGEIRRRWPSSPMCWQSPMAAARSPSPAPGHGWMETLSCLTTSGSSWMTARASWRRSPGTLLSRTLISMPCCKSRVIQKTVCPLWSRSSRAAARR